MKNRAVALRLFFRELNERTAVAAEDLMDGDDPSIADGLGAAPQREVYVEPDPPEERCEGGRLTQAEHAPVRGCGRKGGKERPGSNSGGG